MYVYEATIEKHDDGDGRGPYYFLQATQFAECYASGSTVAEATEGCATALKLAIADMIESGEVLPKPVFSDPPQVVLCVEVSDDYIAASKCVTISEAAKELGVSHGRVCQMLNEGSLEAYMHGGRRMVTIASINKRKKTNPGAGRPRKKE
ncbi:MAG: type II toxin-antitoxin system HicB family antitoxin [Eggerthellaceae bacterium]|nr:type II toxin-antitoxin system HicB family antitoxin [Eggerthellaceae bacterium]